jgi:hypothetical protein
MLTKIALALLLAASSLLAQGITGGVSSTGSSNSLSSPTLGAGSSPVTETWTVGAGGVTANTLVQTDASAPLKIVASTTGFYGVAMSSVSAAGSVEVARFGTVACVTDTGGATAGDLVVIGTGSAIDCKDSGQTSSGAIAIATRIIGVFRSTAIAGATALVELTPAHFGTLVSSVSGNAATATALATAPTKCTAGSYTLGIDVGGNAQSCTALATVATSGAYSDLSGKPTIPTIASTTTPLVGNGSGGASASTPTGTGNPVLDTSATLTTPKIAQINDANGNAGIIVAATTTAVDQVTITNAATTGAPIISATGSDTSIPLVLSMKGTSATLSAVLASNLALSSSQPVPALYSTAGAGAFVGLWKSSAINSGQYINFQPSGQTLLSSYGTLVLSGSTSVGNGIFLSVPNGQVEVNNGTLGTTRDLKYRTSSMTGLTALYNNVATVAMGVPPLYATVATTGNTASVTATNLQCGGAVCPAGLYRVHVYNVVTSTGTGTLNTTVGWTDPAQAQTFASTGIATTAKNYEQFPVDLRADGINNITYATTLSVSGTYSTYITLERLQ